MASQPLPRVSFEEYLLAEQRSEKLHEYHGGEVFEVEAASPHHEQICAQTITAFSSAFSSCRVYGSKLCLYLEEADAGVYPDITVVCGKLETIKVQGLELAIRNPYVLVEVQSPSTSSYDRSSKAGWYRDIPSLQHLLLIHQNRVYIEHFHRDGERWIIDAHRTLHSVLRFPEGELPLSAIYDRIDFNSESA